MKVLFFTALLLAITVTSVYTQACHLRQFDLCMEVGMLHYQSNGIPANEEQVEAWCEIIKEIEHCKGNYSSKCLSPLQREVTNLLSGGKDDALTVCIKGSAIRNRYLVHSECLAEASETDEFKGNVNDLKVMIEEVFNVPFNQRFNLMCCGFKRFHLSVDELASQRCGEDSVEMLRDVMKIATADLEEFICERFDPWSDKCQSILPPPGTKAKGDSKSELLKFLNTIFGGN